MHIQLHARNIEIPQRLREYADKKLPRLEHYLPDIDRIDLELMQEHHHNGGNRAVAQITVRHSRGTILRAEDKTQQDLFAAVDLVLDKILRQISRYKGKRRRRAGDRFEALEPALAAAEPLPEGVEDVADTGSIVRRKQIDVTPMNEEEAIEQMELLGHDFFVFFNSNANTINVLYRRKEGNYGLIDPVLGR